MNLRLALCIVYAGIIFGVSSVPGNRLPSLPVGDYVMHTFEYVALGILIMWWRMHNRAISMGTALFQTILLGSTYGLIDEFHQHFVPSRYTASVDWVADTLGTAIGALVVSAVYTTFSARSGPKKSD